ncbi:MAG: exosortase C-terminal domain/associated protein EpsI [Pseudomonadota bacterium]
MNGHFIRVAFIAGLMVLTGLSTASVKPASPVTAAAPDLETLLPDDFGPWRRAEISQAVLPAESELGPGEAVAYRAYRDDLGRIITLVAAYGPPLGDSVRLHRPEKCYVAQGFEILSRSESRIGARGRSVPIVNLDTQSPSRREAVSYWLRDGDAFTTQSSDNGWRRLKVGSAPLDGALIRVSSASGDAPQFELQEKFLTDFSAALSPDAAAILLGRESR